MYMSEIFINLSLFEFVELLLKVFQVLYYKQNKYHLLSLTLRLTRGKNIWLKINIRIINLCHLWHNNTKDLR